MQYIALIYTPEIDEEPGTIEEYGRFTQAMIAKGYFKAGEPLEPSGTATCVSVRDGEVQLKDGPFSETKEQLGGFYILECADLDEAVACAAQIPGARIGTIEVRPILDLSAA